MDADIILYEPTLGYCSFEYGEQWDGKIILTHEASSRKKSRVDHWRNEIVLAVNAGKLVVVYLVKPIEYCRYTGEIQFSGTGRSRVRTNIVADISSYNAIPNVRRVIPKSGRAIRLEKDGAYLAPYWREFSNLSSYEVELEGDFNKILLKSQTGDRIVGAAFHGKTGGTLLFLPPLSYDNENFVGESEEGEDKRERYWTKAGQSFGKRLLGAIVGLANAIRQPGQTTPPPVWSLGSEFRLRRESELEAEISARAAQIVTLQADKAALEDQLSDAGGLRQLLYEQGKPLEHVILRAMRLMGFEAKQINDGEFEFDGIFVSPEGRCLGEAEGKDNKAISIEAFSQSNVIYTRILTGQTLLNTRRGISFGNAHRLSPPVVRTEFFTNKCISAAKRVSAALIRTPDLFAPARYLAENPLDLAFAKQCREAIFSTSGDIVTLPVSPVSGDELATVRVEGREGGGSGESAPR